MRIFLLILLSVTLAYSRTPAEQAAWFAERWALVEEARNNPSPELIKGLGDIVGIHGRDIQQRTPETQELYYAAQAALIAIPGHAEYYRDRINEMYEEALASAEGADAPQLSMGNSRGWAFATLSHMPSPETVRVLGEMLDDMRSMDRLNRAPRDWPYGDEPPHRNALLAAMTLNNLQLSGSPKKLPTIYKEERNKLTADEYYNVNVEPWRLWYAQVKAGNRTFRFPGSDIEYNLDGPVRVAAAQPTTQRRNEAQSSPEPSVSADRPIWPLLTALGILIASGAWYSLSQRKKNRSPHP